MKPVLPVKNLVRINWVLIIVFSMAVLLFLTFMLEETELHKLLYGVMTAVALGLISFANVAIMKLLSRRLVVHTSTFKQYRFVCTYVASLVIYLVLAPVFDFISPQQYRYSYAVYLLIFVLAGIVVNTVVIVVHDFVILQSIRLHSDLELSRLKTVHTEAANLLLKQQIHPHFLFNALNTVKALYHTNQDMGDSYIVHLANFLRASIHHHTAKTALVAEELGILESYLEMQRIRFGEALKCAIDIPAEIRQRYYLPAFSLQPLLENAIKHNELTCMAPLSVQVYCSNGRIVVCNNLKRRTIALPSAHYGLANLAERSRILSGDEIVVDEKEYSFSVSIKLLSDEYRDH
ncbi:Histidine kinase [Filimonas lacunae]|uniref:Histidine kinase n=1 Tax=Filimonas lacunae TaxID=477680 RepID=A0A173MJA0_9BACT|nr:histidine kinase [Filimonas lacunae]BAV07549.1 autolysin sensor kinase [Filimonas lacunae]SIT29989.1 Histidine kinase [Filimonas lacunae]